MHTGVVKFFNTSKGYGFVIEDKTGQEYFCHITKVVGVIEKGDHVSFSLVESKRGPQAQDVKQSY